MSKLITLYDIPSTLPEQAWSPNTWRARYALNYKGVPYKTVWIEYPDIEALCKKIGAAPTSASAPHYSLPVIQDPSTGAVISDGQAIAEYLDVTYPSTPRLFPPGTNALQYVFIGAQHQALVALWSFILPKANTILNPPSEKYFRRTREIAFGQRLEDSVPTGLKRVEEWGKVKDGFGVIDGWLKKNEGKYILGDDISFADISVVAFTVWLKLLWGEDSEEWQDIKTWHGGRWDALVTDFKKYETIV